MPKAYLFQRNIYDGRSYKTDQFCVVIAHSIEQAREIQPMTDKMTEMTEICLIKAVELGEVADQNTGILFLKEMNKPLSRGELTHCTITALNSI